MKKVFALIMVLALSLMLLVSCGGTEAPEPGKETTKAPEVTAVPGTEEPGEEPTEPGGEEPEPTSPGVPSGNLAAWEAYTAYSEQKSELLNQVMEAMGQNEDLGLEVLNLMGVAMIELMMLPAAVLGQGEEVAAVALGILGNQNVKYSENGNSYEVKWEDEEGSVYNFTSTYDPAKQAMSSEIFTEGEEDSRVLYDFTRTSYGFFAQVFTSDESGAFASVTQISVDAKGGVIGLSETDIQRTPLTGNESRDLPKSLTQWYEVVGTKFYALASDGTSYSYEFVPATD
ncbi:MAG: hypothetical protein PHR78_04995 [Eubacteriales bacterium]|nr:hypothetical protein [Eubacteriales bacterium]MDD4541498.1 hypothetical protein [Eubacteriales bacterium]